MNVRATPTALLLTVLFAVLIGASSCADDAPDQTGPSQPADATTTVRIERSRFGEVELTVRAGTTVRWVNDDAFAHTVTSQSAPVAFDSGELRQGGTFEVTFDVPGTYRYFCEVHPTMRAVVVVR